MRKILILLTILLTLTACSSKVNEETKENEEVEIASINLMADVKESKVQPINILDQQREEFDKTIEITDFSLKMFNNIYEGENTLISPLSIISALSMTANGARNETLLQMEDVLGSDIEGLNQYLHSYNSYLPSDDKYKVNLANSIWFRDDGGITVEEEFLQTNKDHYDAEIYESPFDDTTKDDINAWVNEKTDGQITELLEEKPDDAMVMYLINALSFDAEWQEIYAQEDISEDEFITEDGQTQKVEFMDSKEYGYIEIPNAVGFSKPYADDKYSFVALLPDEGMKMPEFVKSLDGNTLIDSIKNKKDEEVETLIPKFEFEYNQELSETLRTLGMENALDPSRADFSGLGYSSQGNIPIDLVIHKTKIRLDEKGTKAGAVTAVGMKATSVPELEPKVVHLKRPFFFALVDNELKLPIFMGTLNEVGN